MRNTKIDVSKSLSWYIKRITELVYLHTIKYIKSVAYHIYIFYASDKPFDGLNLGSGGANIKNFCNIDANPCTLCDVVARIEKIKLRSNSIGIIYSSHVFEHIPRAQSKQVLAEWYRVLKPNGNLYICVPDSEVLFKVYLDNLSLYHTEEGKYLVDSACFLTFGGQRNKYDFHFNGYSFLTLKDMLESVGFKNVHRFERFNLQFLSFNDISTVEIDGFPMSLNVEASK